MTKPLYFNILTSYSRIGKKDFTRYIIFFWYNNIIDNQQLTKFNNLHKQLKLNHSVPNNNSFHIRKDQEKK